MKSLRIKKYSKIWIGILSLVFFVVTFSNKASAIDYSSINSKALYEGVHGCLSRYNTSFKLKNGSVKNQFMLNTEDNNTVRLPYAGTVVTDNFMGCEDVLFGGKNNFGGLFPRSLQGNVDGNNISAVVEVFSGKDMKGGEGSLGYQAKGNGEKSEDADKRLAIMITPTTTGDCQGEVFLNRFDGSVSEFWNQLKIEEYSSGYISPKFQNIGHTLYFPATNNTSFNFDVDGINVPVLKQTNVYRVCNSNTILVVDYDGKQSYTLYGSYGVLSGKVVVNPDTDAGTLKGVNIQDAIHIENAEYVDVEANGSFTNYDLDYSDPSDKDGMLFLRGISAHTELTFKPSPLQKYDDLKLSDQEIYDLYTYYLNGVFEVPVICEGESNYDTYSDSLEPVKWAKDKNCGARTVDHVDRLDHSVFGVLDDHHFGKTLYSRVVDGRNDNAPDYGIAEVIKMLNSLDDDKITSWLEGGAGAGETAGGSGESDSGQNDDVKTTCMNAGGAQKLGWIVCTVMELLGTAAQDAYEDIVEPSLRVEPQLFSGGNGGVRGAWETFRNFANIAFIILFLVVIFSQLTGVGIDNYGIKKILPKLIVVAILINLSYVLCIVMVDLSNILGNALRGLFDGLGAGLNPSLNIPNSDVNMDSEALTSTVITGVAILGALVAMGGMIWKNPAIVLSLLVAALGVAVSIFFLFVLLAIREAAIVVLVAIAPLAVVCYALPNTKKLFDKWWKFFEGLLLVYPICGLLVGGGNYVSKLLLTSGFAGGSFLQGLTAMIVGIVPIFFIPTVLKGSFAAMGKVGGMLTGMGDRARKGATSRVRENDRFKNLQQRGADRAKMKSLQRRAGGRVGKDGVFRERGLRSAFARTSLGKRLGADVAVGDAREQYVQAQASRMKAANNMNANMATSTIQGLKTELANESLKADVNVELGPKPVLDKQNLRTRTQNEINEALADNAVKAFPVDLNLATLRRRTARDAQEFKAYQDQFGGMSKSDLLKLSNNTSSWYDGSSSNQQKMRALVGAMGANGMEKDIFGMLRSTDVSGSSGVMSELANSSNKVLKAYGKKGEGVKYEDFMKGGGMQAYVKEKGTEFLNGLDDKALSEINTYSSSGNEIMNNELLVKGLSTINSQDAVNELDRMAIARLNAGESLKVSGEELAGWNTSSLQRLAGIPTSGVGAALKDLSKDPTLLNKFSAESRSVLRSKGFNI